MFLSSSPTTTTESYIAHHFPKPQIENHRISKQKSSRLSSKNSMPPLYFRFPPDLFLPMGKMSSCLVPFLALADISLHEQIVPSVWCVQYNAAAHLRLPILLVVTSLTFSISA
ncbi:hypothetical protein ONS96_010747 [Cadophora gregata f. sp. sojae]|nr:hypothetical protein ONS96_010747 [Cadophora gregata f. sp. sojae]